MRDKRRRVLRKTMKGKLGMHRRKWLPQGILWKVQKLQKGKRREMLDRLGEV